MSSDSDLLGDILSDVVGLGIERGERGMVTGRRTSSPVSRRAPADLDVLALTDPRTGVLAVLMHWAGRVRWDLKLPRVQQHTTATEGLVLAENWEWACAQPWGAQMQSELSALRDQVYQVRNGVPLRACPICGEPVRVDRFVREHRTCLTARP